MYIDKRLQVSAQQALTGTSLVASTDVIDLGTSRLIGPGSPLWWVIVARVGLAGTTPTLDIKVQTDDASNFPSAADLLAHPQLAAADFAAGAQIIIPMAFKNERYLRLAYTMGGTTPTCTVDAWLTNQDPQTWKAFPDAI
jgi:hypothetical protein